MSISNLRRPLPSIVKVRRLIDTSHETWRRSIVAEADVTDIISMELLSSVSPPDGFWTLQSARLTAFPTTPLTFEEIKWWERVAGERPESTTIDRNSVLQAGPIPGETRLDGNLILVADHTRIQWQIQPKEEDAPPRVQSLGDWQDAIVPFSELMRKWIQLAPPINRLAFGAVLLHPVEDTREGYASLQAFLPFKIDLDSSDFLFQTNKRIQSDVDPAMPLNRLTKWSVARVQLLTMSASAMAPPIGRQETLLTASRLELDINTAPESADPLQPETLGALWDELCELGRKITEEGVVQW